MASQAWLLPQAMYGIAVAEASEFLMKPIGTSVPVCFEQANVVPLVLQRYKSPSPAADLRFVSLVVEM